MNIISKQELQTLKNSIEQANSKKEMLKLVQETELLSSFAVFVKTAKIADSKQLLLTVINDKLQIFQVQQELETVKKNKSNSNKKQRTVSEKENSSLFSVFDLLFNKSKYLVTEDYLTSENIKSIFSEDKTKNYKADLYRRLKRFATLSEKEDLSDKEKEELKTLEKYLASVFDCEEEDLITILANIDSDKIKIASEKLANERVKQYNFLLFDSYVNLLKTFTVALNSNNLSKLEKVLEDFLDFIENLQNPENPESEESEQNQEENTGKSGKNS